MTRYRSCAFVAASNDRRFRAFDTSTGQERWAADLPASGIAPVISYRDARSGRQFILIAAGGHKPLGARGGDRLVAHALPRWAGRPDERPEGKQGFSPCSSRGST